MNLNGERHWDVGPLHLYACSTLTNQWTTPAVCVAHGRWQGKAWLTVALACGPFVFGVRI